MGRNIFGKLFNRKRDKQPLKNIDEMHECFDEMTISKVECQCDICGLLHPVTVRKYKTFSFKLENDIRLTAYDADNDSYAIEQQHGVCPVCYRLVSDYIKHLKDSRNVSGWYIWMRYYDQDGNVTGYGVHPNSYAQKYSATRRAKQLWGDNPLVTWTVSKTNPYSEGFKG